MNGDRRSQVDHMQPFFVLSETNILKCSESVVHLNRYKNNELHVDSYNNLVVHEQMGEMASTVELKTEFDDQNENEKTDEKESSCGWLNFRPRFLQKFNFAGSLLFCLCAYFFFNSAVINGIYSTSLSTIEKRFNLSSKQMGVVTSIYDVAALIFTGPVSYFGAKNKPKFLSIGMLTMGIGYVIFILPHFIENAYVPVVHAKVQNTSLSSSLLCHPKSNKIVTTSTNCQTKSASDTYYAIFLLAMFIAGAGCTPMLSLGIPFLDECVSKRVSPLYIGIFQSSGIIAAIAGFMLSSVFLGIFVHPGASVNITQKDTESWIGAWWLGFAMSAVFALIISIALSAFPIKMKNKQKVVDEKEEMNNEKNLTVKDFFKSMKILFTNRTFVFISVAVSVESFIISSATAFLPKISVFQFRITPSQAGLYTGLLPGFGALFGNLAGSYIQKRFNLTIKNTLKLAAIVTAMSLIFGSFLFIYCDNPSIAGMDISYKASKSQTVSMQQCNSNCSCPENFYYPICANNITYISPCHAGCKIQSSPIRFANCSCLNERKAEQQIAVFGACKSSCGIYPYLYFGLYFFSTFLVMFVAIPCTMVTLRCVPFRLRSFAVGIQWTSVRIFGAIPGPIIVGSLIDNVCTIWYKSCTNSSKSCRMYDNRKLAITMGVVTAVTRSLVLIFIIFAFLSERKTDKQTKQDLQNKIDETHL